MTNLITLSDFPAYVPFSVNIAAALVDPYIRDAQQFDVWPLLPDALRAELTTPPAGWVPATELLFAGKIKPLLVVEAARRMMLWHGTHVTPTGLEDLAADQNRTPASSQRRAVLSADLQAKAAHYRPLLEAALRLAYPPAAGYCGSSRGRQGAGGLTVSAV